MIAFRATFFIGLLCACHAALRDVGRCTFMEYLCDTIKCHTGFAKAIQKDRDTNCSAKFQTVLSCVAKTTTYCVGHEMSQNQIWNILREKYHEKTFCMYGGFLTPTLGPGSARPCTSGSTQNATLCAKTFYKKFVADRSDPALCSELAKAKKCLKKLIASSCSFSSQTQEQPDLTLRDYNPYCVNNVDPGAIRRDECYGIPTMTPPVSFSTGRESSESPTIYVTRYKSRQVGFWSISAGIRHDFNTAMTATLTICSVFARLSQ